MIHSTLIDSIQGLPSLDSTYWKIPAYDPTGNPFARFTKEALAKIKKEIKYAVRNRVRDNNNARKIEDNDLSELDDVAELIRKAEKIAVFAGAGLSTSKRDTGLSFSYRRIMEKTSFVAKRFKSIKL